MLPAAHFLLRSSQGTQSVHPASHPRTQLYWRRSVCVLVWLEVVAQGRAVVQGRAVAGWVVEEHLAEAVAARVVVVQAMVVVEE